jgi:3-phosphoinositide dependent protein kinase-1
MKYGQVRNPSERLGAAPSHSKNDMHALRSHPFFASVNWKTLWTDPAPPLEAGLVKKEHHPLTNGKRQNWDDIGAAWDELVESSDHGQGSDEIEWASDAERPAYELVKQNGREKTAQEAHPIREISLYASPPVDEDAVTISGGSSGEGVDDSTAVDIPSHRRRASLATASGSSSSNASPTERLALEEAVIGRGRPTIPTPIQGNISDADL